MELNWREVGDRVASTEDNIIVPAGKTMKIETTPNGEEYFSYTVPEGKKCVFFIRVTVAEESAQQALGVSLNHSQFNKEVKYGQKVFGMWQ